MSENPRNFISHAAEDHKLANTWQAFIETISNGQNAPFYSGDRSASGGNGLGDWWAKFSWRPFSNRGREGPKACFESSRSGISSVNWVLDSSREKSRERPLEQR